MENKGEYFAEPSEPQALQDHNALLDSPIRGPTLSTSTSSFEALDPHDPNLSKLATKMFRKTEDYISNELNAPLEDYKLLEEMNKATVAKYSDMQQIAENLSVSTNELSIKFQQLVPLMKQIDEISDTVDKLEAAAYKLDAYSIALENRVKSVLQRRVTMN
ncbi:biogenesis of lysosome-related organelles complex 1 subunit 2 [Bactrocera neohumeralis]|uniref:biogenesis of lysosome-related organelles complex 1 subunit 2 n=1 Tax=Bactrocera tryoni TaxID=59916 RepID=UPI001A995D59|nr:biogenesis of lysosome-related organelles complex 1 subunit 2 [Bactrocera tryoni]XP_050333157.1 biogenesis of lysosome-related organelles complex 1 subunit 2 [Bactrocera neohumeralis]